MKVGGQALLTCDATAADPAGKITLYGVFDKIWAESFPTIHRFFSIYWRCAVSGPGRVGVTILRPDGSTLIELEPHETSQEGPHSMQGTYTLGAFEFPAEGEYGLVLKHNGVPMLEVSLFLQRRAAQ